TLTLSSFVCQAVMRLLLFLVGVVIVAAAASQTRWHWEWHAGVQEKFTPDGPVLDYYAKNSQAQGSLLTAQTVYTYCFNVSTKANAPRPVIWSMQGRLHPNPGCAYVAFHQSFADLLLLVMQCP